MVFKANMHLGVFISIVKMALQLMYRKSYELSSLRDVINAVASSLNTQNG